MPPRHEPARLLPGIIGVCLLLPSALQVATAAAVVVPEVVVSASHIPTTPEAAGALVTTITREQIDARNPADVTELLRLVPGLHVEQAGGRGGLTSLYLRGSDPNFTVVLIDGIKVNDPTNARGGSFDLSTLSVADIERIEIVRGSASAVYGSDAIAGVVSIFTRNGGDEPQAVVEGTVGEYGLYTGHTRLSGPLGESGEFSLHLTRSDGGHPVTGSGFEGTSLGGNALLAVDELNTLRLTLRHSSSEATAFPDDSGGDQLAVIRDVDLKQTRESTLGSQWLHELSDRAELSVNASYYRRNEIIASPGVAPGVRDPFGIPPNSTDNDLYRLNLGAKVVGSLSDALKLSLGVDYERESGRAVSSLLFFGFPVSGFFSLERETYGVFGEARLALWRDAELEVGLRGDNTGDFGTQLSPRAALGYRLATTNTFLKLSYAEGFKLPSFFALGNPIVGNRDLRPETSRTLDLSITQTLASDTTLDVSFFYAQYLDIVDFEPGPPPSLVNRSQVTAKGVDVALATQLTNTFGLNGSVSFVDTDVLHETRELLKRPEWRGSFSALWKPRSDLTVGASVLLVAEVLDSSIPTGNRTLDDYHRVDFATTRQLSRRASVSLSVDNVFNEDYQETLGFTAPGRLFRLGTSLRF